MVIIQMFIEENQMGPATHRKCFESCGCFTKDKRNTDKSVLAVVLSAAITKAKPAKTGLSCEKDF